MLAYICLWSQLHWTGGGGSKFPSGSRWLPSNHCQFASNRRRLTSTPCCQMPASCFIFLMGNRPEPCNGATTALLPFYRVHTMDSLPEDVWPTICSFLHTLVLRQVSKQLHSILSPIYLFQPDWHPSHPVFQPSLQVARLRLRSWRAATNDLLGRAVEHLAPLKVVPHLRVLRLDLSGCVIGDHGAEALSELKDAPSLHTLHLDLTRSGVTCRGARALAKLAQAPSLHTLHLILANCHVGDDGLHRFSKFGEASLLQIFTLDLAFNEVGPNGALALARLYKAPLLHTLRLDLCCNKVTSLGACHLARLQKSATLQYLNLDLTYNEVDKRAMPALATLQNATKLHTLHLNLMCNNVAKAGADALLPLRNSPALRAVHVNLWGNWNPSIYHWRDVVELALWMLFLELVVCYAMTSTTGQFFAGILFLASLVLQILKGTAVVHIPQDVRGGSHDCVMRFADCPTPLIKSWLVLLPLLASSIWGGVEAWLLCLALLTLLLALLVGVGVRSFPQKRVKADVHSAAVATGTNIWLIPLAVLGPAVALWRQNLTLTMAIAGEVIGGIVGFFAGVEIAEWLETRMISRSRAAIA